MDTIKNIKGVKNSIKKESSNLFLLKGTNENDNGTFKSLNNRFIPYALSSRLFYFSHRV